jgi:hypothetical protein
MSIALFVCLLFNYSLSSYEREKQKLLSNYETKIEQVEKKAKTDVDHEKEEKEKALAKV